MSRAINRREWQICCAPAPYPIVLIVSSGGLVRTVAVLMTV